MKCPNCGNNEYKRLDYAIVRCTNCYSLFDPYVYPGFPKPTIEIGQIWDTSSSLISNLMNEQGTLDEDDNDEWDDVDEEDEDEYDDWDEEDEDEVDDYDEWEDEDEEESWEDDA